MKRFWKWVKSLFIKQKPKCKPKAHPDKPVPYAVSPHFISDKVYEYMPCEGKKITDDYRSFRGMNNRAAQSPVTFKDIYMTDKNGDNHYTPRNSEESLIDPLNPLSPLNPFGLLSIFDRDDSPSHSSQPSHENHNSHSSHSDHDSHSSSHSSHSSDDNSSGYSSDSTSTDSSSYDSPSYD